MGNKIYKQSQLGKATAEFEAGNYSKAIQMFRDELKYRPRSIEALRLALRAHLRLYEIDKADEIYAKFYSISGLPEDPLTKAIFIKELLLCDEGKARGIGRELQTMMEKIKIVNIGAPSIQCNRSHFHHSTQQQPQQQQQASTYNNNNNGNYTNQCNQSNYYNNVSSTTEVSYGNNEALSFSRGMLKLLSSQFDEAIALLESEIVSQGSTISPAIRFDAQILIAYCYLKQRMFKHCQTLLADNGVQVAIQLSKDKSFEWKLIGAELLSAQNKLEASLDKFQECLENVPTNSFLMFKLFNLSVRLNNLRQSRTFMERALKARPTDSLCCKMQGDHCIIMKDPRNAIKMFEKGAAMNKKCFRCLESLGDVCQDNQQRLAYYERCAKVSPFYTDVMIKIGIYYMQHSDDYLEALRWFFKALEFRTPNKIVYFCIARSFYQNDQYEYALKNLSISLNLTYEKINDQLSLAVKILNRYQEFFTVSDVNAFLQAIRFKYFQYFQTIADNLENIQFSRLFTASVAPTQMHLHFFALYKVTLARVGQEQLFPRRSYSNPVAHSPRAAVSVADSKQLDAVSVPQQIPATGTSGMQNNYLLKITYTPINKEALQLAEKYFLDLFLDS